MLEGVRNTKYWLPFHERTENHAVQELGWTLIQVLVDFLF